MISLSLISIALTSGPEVGRPTLGSWLNYALGTVNDNLPCYVALTAIDGLPLYNTDNWSAGFLPSIYQGTQVRPEEPRILNLDPPVHLKGIGQSRQLELLDQLNREHLAKSPAERDLEARIASYQLAAKMQTHAREAFDLSDEPLGAGMKAGLIHGATDEWGHEAIDGVVTAPDFHATVMHLFGLDHQKVLFKRNGISVNMTAGHSATVQSELFV